MLLLLKSDLRLLLAQIDGLAETPYFSSELDNYIKKIREVLNELLSRLEDRPLKVDLNIARSITNQLWRLTQFLTGSTAKKFLMRLYSQLKKQLKIGKLIIYLSQLQLFKKQIFIFIAVIENSLDLLKKN